MDGKKRLNGAAYRKKAKERALKITSVISKTGNLTSYFRKLTTANTVEVNNDENSILQTAEVFNEEDLIVNHPFKKENTLVCSIAVGEANYLPSQAHSFAENKVEDEIIINDPVQKEESSDSIIKSLQNTKSKLGFTKTYLNDPALWNVDDTLRDYISIHGIAQDLSELNFSKSKRSYTVNIGGTKKIINRYFKKTFLDSTLINGEIIKRNYFFYSESKGATYCYPCVLFGGSKSFSSYGFSNWKKAVEKLSAHKNSQKHRSNILVMKQRGVILERIDQQLVRQMEFETNNWKSILRRVVAVVKSLSSRGLSFRGDTTQIGSQNNGNFLMAIELIAEGQSYDNASNMSGIYSGVQARIKSINALADFVPCSAHSLNLVGKNAASCCYEANAFFGLIQNLYNFFSISTHRWNILNASIKSLSATRWSARDDACKSLNKNWSSVINALSKIAVDTAENSSTRCEAKGILKKIKSLESSFMSIFWGDILERFNACSKKLQSIQIDLGMVIEIYQSLITYISDIRTDEMFVDYKVRAVEKCGISHFKNTTQQLTPTEVKESAQFLQNVYKNDLAPSFPTECIHFQSHLKSLKKQKVSTMSEDRLNSLAILNIEAQLTKQLDYIDVIEDFASVQSRKKI
ncbi:zinc finger MYM-type protein 1-like [Aphis craccivora]|uniref:Zinc finger MYM-type protein 1-like n=1 Tax=Aphis craccivora TaxID=307492 RepID=A0A6G0WAZ7_APHCR|nr:zinc finger MYM-type protein 1-like [Aphis craccivora]